MELGMVGLGRMGANMTERLQRGGHHVVGFDPNAEARNRVATVGAGTADSLASLVKQLKASQAADGSIKSQFGATVGTSLSLLALALNYKFLPIYER